jgi:hypothetical protein
VGKYKLPPNHELLLSRTRQSLRVEWYADIWAQRSDLESQLEDADPADMGAIEKRLSSICEILGEEKRITSDPLVDYWEEQVARGEFPDLDMTLEELREIKGW